MADKSEQPRDPHRVVLQAELVASSPERVRTWFEQRAADAPYLHMSDNEALERALLERNETLINLALARFASESDVLQALLAGAACDSKAVRLAALMNEVAGSRVFGGMPDALVASRTIEPFISGLDLEEIKALFSNRTLSHGFLIEFFEQKGPWQALDDERRRIAIDALTNNPRMSAKYDGAMDGYAEYRHNEVFEKAWERSGKIPVTVEWAGYLCWLYEKLSPTAFSVKNPLQLASRWVPEPKDAERLKGEQDSIEKGDLGPFARTRKGIARLSVKAAHSKEARQLLAMHEDPGVRAAFYFEGDLSVEDMKAADERDLMLSFNEFIWNERVWRTRAQRERLHTMAWDERRDPKSYLDPQNMYNARLEYIRSEHPDWFKDDEDQEEETVADPDETQPVSTATFSAGVEEIKGGLLTGNQLAQATHVALLKVLRRTAWLGWGVAALLALLLLKSR
jgi:hypothetical protein